MKKIALVPCVNTLKYVLYLQPMGKYWNIKISIFLILLGFSTNLLAQLRVKEDSLNLLISVANTIAPKVDSYIQLSELYRNSNLEKAIEYADKASNLAKLQEDKDLLAKSLINMGIVQYHLDNYIRALELFTEALNIATKENSTSLIIRANSCIGNIYSTMKNSEYAIKYYTEALILSQQVKDSIFTINPGLYANIGMAYFNNEDYVAAEEYTLKAVSLTPESNRDLIVFYNNLSNIYKRIGDTIKCIEYIELARAWNKEHSYNVLDVAMTELRAASFYMNKKDYRKALPCLQNALKSGNDLNSSTILYEVHSLFYIYYKEHKKFKEAMEALEFTNFHKDELFNQQNLEQSIKLKYVTEYKIKDEQFNNQIHQVRYQNRNRTIVLSLIILLSILIIIIIFQHLRKAKIEKVLLKDDMELNNKKIVAKLAALIEKNELIENVINSLRKAKNTTSLSELKKSVSEISIELENSLDNSLWETFESHFVKVYDSFYENIRREYPDISPSELKICALLRMNMTTKEISSMLKLTPGSVDVMRTRIRKKMNIQDSKENLVSILMKY